MCVCPDDMMCLAGVKALAGPSIGRPSLPFVLLLVPLALLLVPVALLLAPLTQFGCTLLLVALAQSGCTLLLVPLAQFGCAGGLHRPPNQPLSVSSCACTNTHIHTRAHAHVRRPPAQSVAHVYGLARCGHHNVPDADHRLCESLRPHHMDVCATNSSTMWTCGPPTAAPYGHVGHKPQHFMRRRKQHPCS